MLSAAALEFSDLQELKVARLMVLLSSEWTREWNCSDASERRGLRWTSGSGMGESAIWGPSLFGRSSACDFPKYEESNECQGQKLLLQGAKHMGRAVQRTGGGQGSRRRRPSSARCEPGDEELAANPTKVTPRLLENRKFPLPMYVALAFAQADAVTLAFFMSAWLGLYSAALCWPGRMQPL
ncbi:unnamed protein product [Effrenium voratum]|uniref:Uncharacterized protein n=1 Tax=Effrenium voratum TaxID=2562239 RepID=A0AA36J8T8_9DINO|nr:unnamed protein product [Effrenium voratum]